MRPATTLRLALAGARTDTARVVLTALAAMLAILSVLAAATVLAIRPDAVDLASGENPGYAYQYTNNLLVEPGLRPGVAFALLLLCIPVLALAGQCTRLGAPARDRRLAAIRMVGATPRQVVAVAVAETGTASAFGAAAGVGVYLAGRALLHRPDASGLLRLPTDVRLAPWLMILVAAALPALAAVSAALLLRRVAFTPFGVVRHHRTGRPLPWPGLLIGLGVGAFVAAEPLARYFAGVEQQMPRWLQPTLLVGGAVTAALGVVLGTAWISHATGRLLHRLARRPAAMVAARRLLADPWSGSRALAALLVCVVVGAGAAGVRAWFTARRSVEADFNRASAVAQGVEPWVETESRDFYLRSLDLVDAAVATALVIAALGLLVFLVEGIVSRRRVFASLVASGVPTSVLARVTGWQVLAPAVPAVLLALAVGATMARGLPREVRAGGDVVTRCVPDWADCRTADSPNAVTVEIPEFVQPVLVPWAQLATIGGIAVAAVIVTIAVGLVFLRPSTEVTELRTG